MDSELERAFFEDVARAEDDASASVRAGVTGDPDVLGPDYAPSFRLLQQELRKPEAIDALLDVVRGVVHTTVHSVMVALDGGSQSAEHELGPVRVVDARGDQAGPGLHELYVDHLFDTGRRT